ncbi:MAG: hypothetical protein ABI968_12250, partial [Acidobacteriota bacterium]
MRPGVFFLMLALAAASGCNRRPEDSTNVTSAQKPADQESRARMVETQIAARGVRDPRVLAAMGKVPRHLFVDPSQRDHAYEDHPLPIAASQTISQPYIV